MRTAAVPLALLCGLGVAACGRHDQPAAQPATLNVYSWASYIAPDTVANFERETGIKVRYDTVDSDEVLETKLLTGHTNYDVVVPSDNFFGRELRVGVLRKLDKAAMPNLVNLDPEIMKALEVADPGNLYGVPYAWQTTGLAYNVEEVRKRLGRTDIDSWSLLFDPRNAAKLQACGIALLDSPTDVLPSALIYLGRDPNSHDPDDLNAATDLLMQIRPFVRKIASVGNITALANGEVCLVLGWSGDMALARYSAQASGSGIEIRYLVPREGAILSINLLCIPADAPNPQNAAKWINYLLRPEVIAAVTNAVKFPNGNRASLPFVDAELRTDPAVYPDAATRARLRPLAIMPPDATRRVTRLWTKFRTGK